MALSELSFNVQRPGQQNNTGDIDRLHIEEYTGVVEGTIARKSALEGFVSMRTVRGTSVISNFSVGESTLQKAVVGQTPDGTKNKFGKNTLTIDTVILARTVLPQLEVFQTQYDARSEIGMEHGKKIAKFLDQSHFIQAIKTGLKTANTQGLDAGAGHFGATQKTLAGANDHLDAAKLYASIADLFAAMERKDVDPRTDDVMIVVKPEEFYTLQQSEMLVNSNYKTANGTNIEAQLLKAYGVPVISSNNFPGGETITGHLLSNADNGNAYDGDFSKVVMAAFSPRALLAGQTIPLETDVFWDKVTKQWFVDAHLSFAVGPNRAEYAGVILRP